MRLGFIHRPTGRVIESVPVPDSENPYILPPPTTALWHYIKFQYFEAMLNQGALHFSRLDKQSDKSDGMYSSANAQQWSPAMAALMAKLKISAKPDWDSLQQTNRILREKAFVHCWTIRRHDIAWMWATFLRGNHRSVALRTTLGRLSAALESQPVGMLRTPYYSRNKPRPDFSYTAPFMGKDKAFDNERELRLLTTDEIDCPDADHKLIPVDARRVILKVVVHPESPAEFRDEVRELLKKHTIAAAVCRSRLTSADLQASVRGL
jgi:hypothetical protein